METKSQFVICIRNDGYPASLQLWKVYRVLPDEKAARRNLIRIDGESGEDYLYTAAYFLPVELSQKPKAGLMPEAPTSDSVWRN